MGEAERKFPDEKTHSEGEGVHREFRDTRGRWWEVYESPIPSSDWTASDEDALRAGYGVGWLRFQSGDTRRHLRLYPQFWNRMTDAELDRLCQHARDGTEPPIL